MSATSPASASPFGRKIKILAILAVAFVVLVVAGWFIGAQLYRTAIEEGRAALAREGVTLACADESLGGFPARFEWRCSSLALSMANGAQMSGGAFNTVSPVWNPLFAIAEWTGPFRSISANGFDADIASDLLRASIRMTTSLELERLSAVLDPFAVSLQGAPQPIASGEQAEMHVRQPENASEAGDEADADLEVALVFFGLESLFLGGVDRIDTSLTATLEELANVRARSVQDGIRNWVARSGAVTPLAWRVRLDDHGVNLDGNATIGIDGLIDFDGTIATNDVAALVDLIGIDSSNGAAAITAGATLFGRQVERADMTMTELPLRVSRNAVSIGPVPLGVLPPLQF
jgi:hypothetical protein